MRPTGGHHYDAVHMRCPDCGMTPKEVFEGRWHKCVDAGLWPREVLVPLRQILRESKQ